MKFEEKLKNGQYEILWQEYCGFLDLGMESYMTIQNRPFLRMYVEISISSVSSRGLSKEILKEHLTVYFKYVDHDYKNLKHILGMEPLEITILKTGSFEEYEKQTGRKMRHINPSVYQIKELLSIEKQNSAINNRRSA